MWFGTDRGLVRFDGYKFTVYTSGKTALLDNTIFGLYMDHRRRIWYQSYIGYTGYILNGVFYQYQFNRLLKSIIKSGRIDGLNIDRRGGLMFINQINKDCIPIYLDSAGKAVKVDRQVYKDIYVTSNNACLTIGATDADTTRIISQETMKVLYTFPNPKAEDTRSFVTRRRNGDMIVCSASEMLVINSRGTRKLFSCNGQVLSILIDQDDDIWVGYMNKGIDRHKASENYAIAHNILSGNSVSGMAQDREGGLWFTTLENGIFYLAPGKILSYGEASGFPKMKVARIEKVGKQMECILSDHRMFSIAIDEGNVEERQLGYGMNDIVYDHSGLTYYATNEALQTVFRKNTVRIFGQRIHVGKYNIWSHSIGSVNQLNVSNKSMDNIVDFVPSRVTCIYEIGKNEVLIGTIDGLYIFQQGKLTALTTKHIFFKHRISHIVKLNDHTLVVASIGYGLMIVDIKNYTGILQLTSANGLPSDMCNKLLRLDDQTLLLGTNNGVCRITHITTPKRVKYSVIDISNGLISNEVNDMKLVGDDLWVATGGGVSIIPLSHFDEKNEMVFMNIGQVRVNNLLINTDKMGEFDYNQNNLHIFFTGINHQHSSKLLYQYRLKGSSEKWNITQERSVIYDGLAPGEYTFEVTVTGLNSVTHTPITRYSFCIEPPFWATWWFYILSGLVIVGCMYWLVARRIRVIRKQSQLQHDLSVLRDKALRAQMNPHFVFNSMNAIQNYIQKHDTQASIDYLSMFSRLMRTTFNNSGKKEVSLEEDLEAVSLYAAMENLRFAGKFKLHISYGNNIDPAGILVPPLLIQPFVENSIIHGFQTKLELGNIWLHIDITEKGLEISIKDDGVGRKKTLDILKRSQTFLGNEHTSSGITVTLERIRQAWGEDFSPDIFTITDLYTSTDHPSGTLIKFFLPIKPI